VRWRRHAGPSQLIIYCGRNSTCFVPAPGGQAPGLSYARSTRWRAGVTAPLRAASAVLLLDEPSLRLPASRHPPAVARHACSGGIEIGWLLGSRQSPRGVLPACSGAGRIGMERQYGSHHCRGLLRSAAQQDECRSVPARTRNTSATDRARELIAESTFSCSQSIRGIICIARRSCQ
jgi:hypothetical protein